MDFDSDDDTKSHTRQKQKVTEAQNSLSIDLFFNIDKNRKRGKYMLTGNKQKRLILIFTGSVTSLVAISLLAVGFIFLISEGEMFGLAIILFGLVSIWFAMREFKEYHQVKSEAEAAEEYYTKTIRLNEYFTQVPRNGLNFF